MHRGKRRPVYASYDPAGQANGRLLSRAGLRHHFLPHALGPEERAALAPLAPGQSFVVLDYRHMEVAVLQWLSGDEELGAMLGAEDFYAALYRRLSGTEGDREVAKRLFLPTVYGLTAEGLAQATGTSVAAAEFVQRRLHSLFPTAFRWVADQVSAGTAADRFGRLRRFEDRHHRVRNFVVQSPAGLLCLRQLVELEKRLGCVVCSVHDGYVLQCRDQDVQDTAERARDILVNSVPASFAGVKLKATCHHGKSLADLQKL